MTINHLNGVVLVADSNDKLTSMANTGKILVSMTSYPGRIKNVGISIFLLLERQTLPPDEIHLWLAIPQFPNKEADLPDDLQTMVTHPKVKLHWLPENTYVHKRHEIFNIAEPEDCVFLIDDDVKYADNLIETVMGVHKTHPGCIVCYNNYAFHEYKGKRILYRKAMSTQSVAPVVKCRFSPNFAN